MNLKFLVVFLFHLSLSLQLQAEGQWFPGIAKVYESDVIVEAIYVRQTNDHFWIKINKVLRGEQLSLIHI